MHSVTNHLRQTASVYDNFLVLQRHTPCMTDSLRRDITRDDDEAVYVVLTALYQREQRLVHEPLHETIAFLYDEYAASDPPVPREELNDDEAANRVVRHNLSLLATATSRARTRSIVAASSR